MQSGFIEALQIQREKGLPFVKLSSIELESGKGIVRDCHFGVGEKQITLIASKVKLWMGEQEMNGLCLSRFKENIVTTGIDYSILTVGDILKTEHAMLEITSCSKRCFLECNRIQNNLPCELKNGTGFAKVVQSGTISVGEQISINKINR